MNRHVLWVVAVSLVAVLQAACGSDDNPVVSTVTPATVPIVVLPTSSAAIRSTPVAESANTQAMSPTLTPSLVCTTEGRAPVAGITRKQIEAMSFLYGSTEMGVLEPEDLEPLMIGLARLREFAPDVADIAVRGPADVCSISVRLNSASWVILAPSLPQVHPNRIAPIDLNDDFFAEVPVLDELNDALGVTKIAWNHRSNSLRVFLALPWTLLPWLSVTSSSTRSRWRTRTD